MCAHSTEKHMIVRARCVIQSFHGSSSMIRNHWQTATEPHTIELSVPTNYSP